MMTRCLFVGAVAGSVLLVSLIGCGKGSPKDTSDWTYTPPDGFKQQDKDKNGATVFLGPRDDGFTANLMVKAGTNSNDSAKQIGEQTLSKLTTSSGVTVKEQEAYTIPDSDAYTWLITKKLPNGLVAEQRQFVVIKNGIVVEFTLSAAESVFGKYDQVLADSLQTFKWGH
jgi:hypothetical protein